MMSCFYAPNARRVVKAHITQQLSERYDLEQLGMVVNTNYIDHQDIIPSRFIFRLM